MRGKWLIMIAVAFIASATVVALISAQESTKKVEAVAKVGAEPNSELAQVPQLKKNLKITRGLTTVEQECIECHAKQSEGMVRDWMLSLHGRSNVTCLDCHRAASTDKDAMDCPGTEKYADLKITPIVSPKDCAKCHPQEAEQFSKSKHARTFDIIANQIKDPWMKGMTNDIERATGCDNCHGSDISSGKLTDLNWPNEGCGRKNPDGSLGTCTTCHTKHKFSIAEARKPETCGQCHLGPDHPQQEIYNESKHGKRYQAEGDQWTWTSAPDLWEPGSDYTAPTCATCHISGIGPLETTHELSTRLKWESQAPTTVMNKDQDGHKARKSMITVCRQCHSKRWSENYMTRYDKAIANYNDNYWAPVKTKMDELYEKKLLTKWPAFDEEIEWVYYEFWHHEGRRARMGSGMMAPDYAWWHGFYELKRHYQKFFKLAHEVEKRGHGSPMYVPGTGGKNLTPADVSKLPEGWKDVPHLTGQPQ